MERLAGSYDYAFMIHHNTYYIMFVLNIPVLICMFFVQATTKYMYYHFKNFPGGYPLGTFSDRRPFGCSLMHDDHQILAAMRSSVSFRGGWSFWLICSDSSDVENKILCLIYIYIWNYSV